MHLEAVYCIAANLLIQCGPKEAQLECLRRMSAYAEDGEVIHVEAWNRVIEIIKVLQRAEPESGPVATKCNDGGAGKSSKPP